MRYLKKADYFRKFISDDQHQTCVGACLSLLSLLLIILFSTIEFSFYLKPILNREVTIMKTESSISSEGQPANGVPLNIDLVLYSTPCESTGLYIKQHEIFGQRVVDPKFLDDFYLYRLSSSGTEIAEDYISPEVIKEHSKFGPHMQRLMTQITDREGCRLSGKLMTNKSPGTLQILVNWNNEEIELVQRLVDDLPSKIKMDHKLLHLSFGDLQYQRSIQQKFLNSTPAVTEFNKAVEIPELRQVNHCDYFMKIIPHKFFLGSSAIDEETYQYSVHYQCSDEDAGEGAGHQLTFMHEISSVGIKYRKQTTPLMVVMVSVVSIIGGVYVIMSIINRFIGKFI